MSSTGLFNPSIFFIILRETIESALIVSVLLSFTTQLILSTPSSATKQRPSLESISTDDLSSVSPRASSDDGLGPDADDHRGRAVESVSLLRRSEDEENVVEYDKEMGKAEKALKRKMDLQIWLGVVSGFLLSLFIGVVFILIFFETLAETFALAETLWEGIFSLLSSIFILITGLSFLRLDRARIKWRIKLAKAFENVDALETSGKRKGWNRGRWALWILPFVTLLREGLEGVIFVAGAAVTQPETIPISILSGILVGLIIGYMLYRSTSSKNVGMHTFIIFSSCLLFLVGGGLFATGVARLEAYPFERKVGGDLAESGSGPGSYDLRGNVFHFDQDWLNPEIKTNGWAMIAQAAVGWNNNGTICSISAYIFWWFLVAAACFVMKAREGRVESSLGGLSKFLKSSRADRNTRSVRLEETESDEPLRSSD
ncbi:Iron permease FTR1 [Phaffia rhodozyma]|uniref:Iron permease FTR1 n=1 Tax=Phaffia rhodozyma TaxID=264483 RepID=A0A0F7SFZ0_PHARH|nr:Iron permease FTR1 [Phaffia rhodozyma]